MMLPICNDDIKTVKYPVGWSFWILYCNSGINMELLFYTSTTNTCHIRFPQCSQLFLNFSTKEIFDHHSLWGQVKLISPIQIKLFRYICVPWIPYIRFDLQIQWKKCCFKAMSMISWQWFSCFCPNNENTYSSLQDPNSPKMHFFPKIFFPTV